MQAITTIGHNITKSVFQVHGVEAHVLYAVQQPFQEIADDRKDDECRVAHQAVLLCGVHSRPDDQSRPGALHGQANECEDDRDRGEPPGADLTTRCDHEPHQRHLPSEISCTLVAPAASDDAGGLADEVIE
jgi:hypothetical protein